MPMNGSQLGKEMANAVRSVEPMEDLEKYRAAIFEQMGWAIVKHIIANAQYTIPPMQITTNGSATTQIGPPGPVLVDRMIR